MREVLERFFQASESRFQFENLYCIIFENETKNLFVFFVFNHAWKNASPI